MKIEICIDSADGAVAAAEGGADRVELCDNLIEGGTTPSAGAIKRARALADIELMVIVRPRGGDFLYSEAEFEVMREDVRMAGELGADGVVIGCLLADGRVDSERTALLIEDAGTLSVTFHRAFDVAADPYEALEELAGLGVDRVLTSGQEASAHEGIDLITALQKQAAGRIIIMPGGGLTAKNVRSFIESTGVTEVHMTARSSAESQMTFRNPRVCMGATGPDEYQQKVTDPNVVRDIVQAIRR